MSIELGRSLTSTCRFVSCPSLLHIMDSDLYNFHLLPFTGEKDALLIANFPSFYVLQYLHYQPLSIVSCIRLLQTSATVRGSLRLIPNLQLPRSRTVWDLVSCPASSPPGWAGPETVQPSSCFQLTDISKQTYPLSKRISLHAPSGRLTFSGDEMATAMPCSLRLGLPRL